MVFNLFSIKSNQQFCGPVVNFCQVDINSVRYHLRVSK